MIDYLVEQIINSRTHLLEHLPLITMLLQEMFLLKCGSADGQYYVFLNDELSEERENQILKIFEITEFTTFFDETTNNLYRGDDT